MMTGPDRPVRQTASTRASALLTCGGLQPDSGEVSGRLAARGSSASGWPRDVGPRCERWRALDGERDAAFEPPSTNLPVEVLTRPPGETRRRISSIGGVAVGVSRDATLRS